MHKIPEQAGQRGVLTKGLTRRFPWTRKRTTSSTPKLGAIRPREVILTAIGMAFMAVYLKRAMIRRPARRPTSRGRKDRCRHVERRGKTRASGRQAARPRTVLLGGDAAAISGTLATMGPGVGYALAAKFAFPGRPAVAFVSDGAMQKLGMNGRITAAKYYRRWSDPRLIIVVLNNRDLNMVSWELCTLGGARKVAATQDLPDIDYAAQAELLGLKGLTVAAPGDVGRIWDEALAADQRGFSISSSASSPACLPAKEEIRIDRCSENGETTDIATFRRISGTTKC